MNLKKIYTYFMNFRVLRPQWAFANIWKHLIC